MPLCTQPTGEALPRERWQNRQESSIHCLKMKSLKMGIPQALTCLALGGGVVLGAAPSHGLPPYGGAQGVLSSDVHIRLDKEAEALGKAETCFSSAVNYLATSSLAPGFRGPRIQYPAAAAGDVLGSLERCLNSVYSNLRYTAQNLTAEEREGSEPYDYMVSISQVDSHVRNWAAMPKAIYDRHQIKHVNYIWNTVLREELRDEGLKAVRQEQDANAVLRGKLSGKTTEQIMASYDYIVFKTPAMIRLEREGPKVEEPELTVVIPDRTPGIIPDTGDINNEVNHVEDGDSNNTLSGPSLTYESNL